MINVESIIKGIDPNLLRQNINNIDPIAVLKQMNISEDDAHKILAGTHLPGQEPNIIDFNLIVQRYKSVINLNLIKYFFKKARNKESFTKDEMTSYHEAYNGWFELVFKVAGNNTIQFSKELNDKSVIIKVAEQNYIMATYSNIKQIIPC